MPTGFLYCIRPGHSGAPPAGLLVPGPWHVCTEPLLAEEEHRTRGRVSHVSSRAPSQSCSSALRASRPWLSWNSLSQRSFCLYQDGRLPKEVVTRKQSKNCYNWMPETFSLVLDPAEISTFQEGPPGIVLRPLASPMSLQVSPNTFPSSYLGVDLI